MLDYSKLAPGMIIGTTCVREFAGALIRTIEDGPQHAFDGMVAEHVLCVCESYGLKYGMEMGPRHKDDRGPQLTEDDNNKLKIRRVDLKDYDGGKNGNHIVFVADPFGHTGAPWRYRDAANRFLWTAHALGIGYDTLELVKFLKLPVYDSSTKWICSDLSREMIKGVNRENTNFPVSYPKEWDEKTSPFDQQKYYTETNQLVAGVSECCIA